MVIPFAHILIHRIMSSEFAWLAVSLGNVFDHGFKSAVIELVPQNGALGQWSRVPENLCP